MRYSWREAYDVAVEVKTALAESVEKINIAGSIRRKLDTVHDVDIVCLPVYVHDRQPSLFEEGDGLDQYTFPKLMNAVARFQNVDIGNKIIKFEHNGIPVELYLAEPGGWNYGALWQMRTGSPSFNVDLCMKAQDMGLRYSAGYGIYRENTLLTDETETSIFKALNMNFVPPEARV